MDSSSSTMDNSSSLMASLQTMDIKELFKHLDDVTKALKQKVKEASKGRRHRKNKGSDSADGSSTTSSKTQPPAVLEWNTQCKEITALYKASLPKDTKLKPGFHLRLAGAVKHLAGDKPISVTAETVAEAVAFLEEHPDWSTKTTKSRAESKAKKSSTTSAPKASSAPKKADPESDADSDAEPEVKPAKNSKKADKAKAKEDKKSKKSSKAASKSKKQESDSESDSDSETEAPKAKAKEDKKSKKAGKAKAKEDKKSKKSSKKAAKQESDSESSDSESEDEDSGVERISIDGKKYWLNSSSNDVYEDVDGSLGEKVGKLNEDGDGIISSA